VIAASLRETFGATTRPLAFSAFFYLLHLLLQGSISGSQIALGLSILALGVAIWKRQTKVEFHPVYFPLILFIVASAISSLMSKNPAKSIADIGEAYGFLTVPVGLTLYRSIPKLTRMATGALFILTVYLSLHGIYQYFFRGYYRSLDFRISGPTAHVMTFGGILLPLGILFISLFVQQRRWTPLAAGLVASFALLLTFTRGAWIGWLAGVVMLLALRMPRALLWGAPVLVLAITLSPMTIFTRLASTFTLESSSNLDRVRMLQAGAEIIDDHPIFGVGPTNIKEVYPLYRRADAPRFRIPHLHNNVVHIWAERGFLALLAYGLLLFVIAAVCLRARSMPGGKAIGDTGLAILVAVTIAGLFEYSFGDSEVQLMMLDLFVLIFAILEKRGIPAPGRPDAALQAV
jgi:O-antigen ligase